MHAFFPSELPVRLNRPLRCCSSKDRQVDSGQTHGHTTDRVFVSIQPNARISCYTGGAILARWMRTVM